MPMPKELKDMDLHQKTEWASRIVLDGIYAGKYGLQIADEAVEKFRLDKLFGIQPEVVRQVGKAIAGD